MKPLNSGHLRVLKNLSVIKRCRLFGGSLIKIATFGTKHFVRYYGKKNHWHLLRSSKSYRAIKSSVTQNSKFNLPHATTQDKKNHQYVSSDKATGPNVIPVKFIKLSTSVIDRHLAYIINKDIDLNCYSENGKIVNVRLIFKKDEKTKVKNDQPVSLLNMFPKIYERFIHGNLTLL